MLTRRQAIWATSAALIAPTLPTQAAPPSRTIHYKIDYESLSDRWDQDICWVKGSHADRHEIDLRVPSGRGPLTMRARFDYAPLDQFHFDDQLFHDAEAGDKHLYGFAAHYGTSNSERAQNAINVLDGDNRQDDNTSIYLVSWGAKTIHMASEIVPISTKALPDKAALVIADWRYAARVANLSFWYAEPEHIASMMAQALFRLPTATKAVFYAAPDLLARMPAQGKHGIVIGNHSYPVRSVKALNHWENVV